MTKAKLTPDERWFETEVFEQLAQPIRDENGRVLTPTEIRLRMLIRHLRGAVGQLRRIHGPNADLAPCLIDYLHGLARLPEAEAEEFIDAMRGQL